MKKHYYNFDHLKCLMFKYKVDAMTIGYLYGKLQEKTSMIQFEKIIEDLSKQPKDVESINKWREKIFKQYRLKR